MNLNHPGIIPPISKLLKNYLSQNCSQVPERLGTTVIKDPFLPCWGK